MLADQKNQSDEVVFEIEDKVEESPKEEIEVDISELSEPEKKMAESFGYNKKETKPDEHKEQPEPKTVEDTKKEEEIESPTFEQVESNEKLVDKYNKNEKALYWKWKSDKNKRQDAQKRLGELEEQFGLDKIKASIYEKRLEKLKAALTNDTEDLTVEKIRNILEEKVEPKEVEAKPEFSPDAIQKKVAVKSQFAEKIGESRYENFHGIATLAKEVIDQDKTGTYQSLIDKSFIDDNVDENTLVERIVSIAKLSDKYAEISKSVKPENKENIDRVLKNSKKKVSSASLPTAGGKRIISHEDLTIEDAARLSNSEWAKLPDKTKKRILMGISP